MLELDATFLESWLVQQRWFASKTRDLAQINLLEGLELRDDPPLVLALLEARFAAGTHELYQLLLTGHAEQGAEEGSIATRNGFALYDALEDLQPSRELARLLCESTTVQGERGTATFHWVDGAEPVSGDVSVRPVGVEQSNSSVVLDERLVLKAFRRLQPGDNPELEMVRFLTSHGFAHIARLAGWYEYSGELMDATLGVVQEFVADAVDGWELALDGMGAGAPDFEAIADLGRVTGGMHRILGSDGLDADFAPEEPGMESLGLLTATIDEEIERMFVDLPAGVEALEPLYGRGEELRDLLQALSHVGAGGRLIRTHGDFHLGQTLRQGERWVIIDFEGEPARSLRERRRKRSPLRDVAGMLRSFAYAASASQLLRGVPAPADWEATARASFLGGYHDAVDPALLPAGQAATEKLLSIFELEKAIYELRYELNNRPEWVGIPVAGIARLLDPEEPAP